jgi:hypothetical protein
MVWSKISHSPGSGHKEKNLDEAHLSKFTIHPGSTKMYRNLRENFWWSNMKGEIAEYVSGCDTCQRIKASHLKTAGQMQPLFIPARKWDNISMVRTWKPCLCPCVVHGLEKMEFSKVFQVKEVQD